MALLRAVNGSIWASAIPAIVDHYRLVAPIMERIFGCIPIVWTTSAAGDSNHESQQGPIYHGRYFGHYSHLSSEHVQHLVSIGAQEFHSWFPIVEDASRARFARFLLERSPEDAAAPSEDMVRRAALFFNEILQREGCAGIPVLDGVGGVSIFVLLANGPSYPDVRAWAHGVARSASAAHPDLLSEAPNVHADGRVHIQVSSNAQGRWSILPYSVRTGGVRVATPVTWDELEHVEMTGVAAHDFPARLAASGEVFSKMLGCSAAFALPAAARSMVVAFDPLKHGRRPHKHRHGEIISTVSGILSDGKSRTAAEIWKIAQDRHLPCSDTVGDLSNNVWSYIERNAAHGNKPVVVPTDDHKFRINEPADEWPDEAPDGTQTAIDIEALITRLTQAATDSNDSAAFEIAVCDAFAAMGLLSTHVGGLGAPDGFADAPLGTMGYRVMFECKSGTTLQKGPDVFEAAKFKDAYRAKYCALIGSQSGTEQLEALSEIKTHGVSLWGADDIAYALRAGFGPLDLQAAFAPGAVAQEVLPDILWARDHGQTKRVRIIANIIRSAGWTTQCAAAQANMPADAPVLTQDAAMLMVDQALAAENCRVNCTRDGVRLAFEWLTNPLNAFATWTADKAGIVITRGQQGIDGELNSPIKS